MAKGIAQILQNKSRAEPTAALPKQCAPIVALYYTPNSKVN